MTALRRFIRRLPAGKAADAPLRIALAAVAAAAVALAAPAFVATARADDPPPPDPPADTSPGDPGTDPTPPADTTPPDTILDSSVAALVNVGSATFTFHSTEDGSTFRCSIDGADATDCASPASLSGLADGAHTLSVAAVDTAGNVDATPATAAWTVDTVAPASPTGLTGDASTPGQVTLSWSASADADVASYQVLRDGSALATGPTPGYVDPVGAGPLTYTYSVIAVDQAGNVSASSDPVTVDVPAPSPDPGPGGDPSPDPQPPIDPAPPPEPSPSPGPQPAPAPAPGPSPTVAPSTPAPDAAPAPPAQQQAATTTSLTSALPVDPDAAPAASAFRDSLRRVEHDSVRFVAASPRPDFVRLVAAGERAGDDRAPTVVAAGRTRASAAVDALVTLTRATARLSTADRQATTRERGARSTSTSPPRRPKPVPPGRQLPADGGSTPVSGSFGGMSGGHAHGESGLAARGVALPRARVGVLLSLVGPRARPVSLLFPLERPG